MSLEITAVWNADEVNVPEERANNGALASCWSWRNSFKRASIGQATSFIAARTMLTPLWFWSVLLLFRVRRVWLRVGENLTLDWVNFMAVKVWPFLRSAAEYVNSPIQRKPAKAMRAATAILRLFL